MNVKLTRADTYVELEKHFDQAFEFVEMAASKKAAVLIHSMLGQNRANTFVIAFLIKKMGWSLQKAFKFVKDKRSFTTPSNEYMYQLQQYETKILGTNSMGTYIENTSPLSPMSPYISGTPNTATSIPEPSTNFDKLSVPATTTTTNTLNRKKSKSMLYS